MTESKGGPNKWAANHAATAAAAQAIIDGEALARDEKTIRLREQRLAREATAEGAPGGAAKTKPKAKAAPLSRRALKQR